MGRPRTATKILEMKGAFKVNPERKRPAEPEVTAPFPMDAPNDYDGYQLEAWNEIVGCVPDGVLTGADLPSVKMVVLLYAEFLEKGVKMPSVNMNRLATDMGKLGLNPADRAKLSVEKPKPKDPGFK